MTTMTAKRFHSAEQFSVGDRYSSPVTGNVFRVVYLEGDYVVVRRENNKGQWDEGITYAWIPESFNSMTKITAAN
jgi:hypothetical protein